MKRSRTFFLMPLLVVVLFLMPSVAWAQLSGDAQSTAATSTTPAVVTPTATPTPAAAQTTAAVSQESTSAAVISAAPSASPSVTTQGTASVSYSAHVQDIGWQSFVSDGATAGTTGEAKRVEAIKATLSGVSGSIDYHAYIQDIGWGQAWASNGAVAGTTGQAKRVEAVQFSLSGTAGEQYDVYYRVHVQDIGWMAWAKDGEIAGTSGMGLRIEAMQVVLVKKSDSAPSDDGSYYASYVAAPSLSYRAHVQDIGWQGWVDEGEMAGTTGRALRVEAVQARLASGSDQVAGGIDYHAHIQDIGWDQAWASNGGTAGTTGQAKRVEAVQFSLSGAVADLYDVYYRVHIQDYGWLGWAEDGEIAGSTGRSKRVEAMEVVLVRKGEAAPGDTDNHYLPPSYIYIDAGHGWNNRSNGVYDGGAAGNGYVEAEQNNELADKVASYARSLYGLQVYCNAGDGLSLGSRTGDALSRGCTSLVAIHFNSGGGTGSENYYNSSVSGSREVGSIMNGYLASGVGLTNRGLKDYDWTVISNGSLPGTLLEICFIDNSYDMNTYKAREDFVARKLAAGLFELSASGY